MESPGNSDALEDGAAGKRGPGGGLRITRPGVTRGEASPVL
jgi:hypothetical protein